ncbi:MAG: MATE family efflux transporter [Candidatus Eisenbacteria bacterium]
MSGAAVEPRTLTQSVPRALVGLALPILASQTLRLAFQWVDALWVRGLGVQATAAITTSVFVMWCVYSLHDVFGIGISAYVSQLVGAGDRARAGVAARKGLIASACMGLAGVALGLFAPEAIFRAMDPEGSIVAAGASYLRVVLIGAPFLMTSLSCENVLRACGDTRTPFLVDFVAIAVNAALAPVFIYGLGPFPAMGVAGAAWATVCAQVLMFVIYATLAWRRHPSLPLARRADGPPVHVRGMARVGLPAASIGVLFSVVYIAFVRSASVHGAAAAAIVGVANRIEAIQFVFSASLGLGAASLLGQALGASRPERAAAVLRTAQVWSVAFACVLTLAMFFAPGVFLGMFTKDAEVFAIGVPYLRVLALTVVATALEITTAEAVMGSGHTTAVSWIYTIVSLARIPLAFLVPAWTHSGVMGIVWLITVSCWVRTAAVIAWSARGTWKRGLGGELHGTAVGSADAPGEAL